MVKATVVNQWKDTESVLAWFKNIPDKPDHSFICLDVVDFYPTISEDLLTKALSFASEYDEITEEEKDIIIQGKRSMLFNDNESWCKKSADSQFDVTMGSFDGTETCELVGSYLLSKLPTGYRSKIGLYRDDDLAAFNLPPTKIESIKKKIFSTFGEHNLKLTIEANKKSVNFLDVTSERSPLNLTPSPEIYRSISTTRATTHHQFYVIYPQQLIAGYLTSLPTIAPLTPQHHHIRKPSRKGAITTP